MCYSLKKWFRENGKGFQRLFWALLEDKMQYCYKFCKQCLSSKFWLMSSWVLVLITSMGVTDYIKKSGIFSESLKKNKLKDNIFTIRLLKNFSVSLFVLCFVTPLKPWNWNASFHRSRELAIWENISDWIRTKSQLKSFTRNPPPRCFHMRIAFKWFFSKVGGRMVVVDYTNPRNLMLKSRQAEPGWPNRRLCCDVIAVNFLEYV